ncbi:GntR family transcriptional regulator [Sphingobium indicum IP26]|uniref:GntR family transcriptional regulator n=1 Tax=Sphingobium indicum F2 TaxID=1450518 RepID=A0A8E0WVU2_9SPHN|nr:MULTISPECIES: GntR family transcriptional regulator [Sphingobium]EPR08976.1 GntR family transcriptional regulator [Sphingobium indicum IP26]EQB06891.1 GntR family transcriptional regulator [Sphingobium sp. HDIP04]KER38418.1 GntR family transcriptional regulator [Sphingobium indicum F2]
MEAGLEFEPAGTARKVVLGILAGLDERQLVPGQRLAETDLALRYDVGRNAVREAMQHLSVRGIIELEANRSPSIRKLDLAESMEVLDVAEAMTALAARTAAGRYVERLHGKPLRDVLKRLDMAAADREEGAFNTARRQFYRVLLRIGDNRELRRLFPSVGMHIIHVQYSMPELQKVRRRDYADMAAAVMKKDAALAEAVARRHVDNVRGAIADWHAQRSDGHMGAR